MAPLPLVIDYNHNGTTAEDDEVIILAFAHCDRVRRIRFYLPVQKLQKLIMVMVHGRGEYSILEYRVLDEALEDKSTLLILPEALQIPYLRHLMIGYSIPICFHLLTTAVGLVTLQLALYNPSTYFQPTVLLLQSLSLMPQLEMLLIFFFFPVLNRDMERQLMSTPFMTHVTLPNIRTFLFQAVSAYSVAALSQITAPRLEDFQIYYFNQLTFSVRQLLQFMGRTQNLRFGRAKFYFYNKRVYAEANPPEANMSLYVFSLNVDCWSLDWRVSSVAQIFNARSPILDAVEELTLWNEDHSQSSGERNEVDRTQSRKLLRSFSNLKALHIDDGLIKELSRSLPSEDGEDPLELLPKLQELTHSGRNVDDACTPFIDARQNAGRPVNLIKM